jgi:AmmeMemoRadiSam system protein A
MKPKTELSSCHQETLLLIARTTLEQHLKGETPIVSPPEYVELQVPDHGVFVSLHRKEQLRGCLGCFSAPGPLWQTVMEFSMASASDSRFVYDPVTFGELCQLQIEISVLSPLRRIKDYKEAILGEHGIVVEKGAMRGVFLPQVATETGWTLEEFWSQCCSLKTGLGPDAYKDSSVVLSIFDAQVFSEKPTGETLENS